ncbi:MAG: ubiquitin-specific protease otu1 [Cirrosporium novae-zelandiae]|nr:MAG: ubiquitin-specific protease otu1 [Cirrosporium novae-zelandiae]
MRIRVRGPLGQSTINIEGSATIDELRSDITKQAGVQDFNLKYGYPPKPLDLSHYDPSTVLSDLAVKLDGEQLLVSPKDLKESSLLVSTASKVEENTPSTTTKPPHITPPVPTQSKPRSVVDPSSSDPPEVPMPSQEGTIVLRVMPDDNSCLFRALSTALLGNEFDGVTELRSVIAQVIQEQPDKYTKVVLEKSPDDYCRWIQRPDSWGGAIELGILSQYFGMEICSIDVQTLRVDKYNEGRSPRCIVVYSGIHYDTIALSKSEYPFDHAILPPDCDLKVFDPADQEVLEKSLDLCRILQQRHYYTDTANFTIRCNDCGGVFIGEKEATEHAKTTGHYNFGEST